MVKELAGIYAIRNIINGHIYIGQASDLYHRKAAHFSFLRSNTHHNKYLQRAFRKYGEEMFSFDILLYCEKFELTRYEQGLVDRLHPEYNILTLCVDSPRGIIKSEEIKRRVSQKLKGRIFTAEHRQRKSDAQRGEKNHRFGKVVLEETRQKLSKAHKGIKNPFYGKHHTEETKKRLSEIALERHKKKRVEQNG